MLNFHLVTLFPEFFDSPLHTGLYGRALAREIVGITCHNPRDFSNNRHRHVDDRPFGGGAGMVMQVEPVLKAVKSIENPGRILLLSPSGKPFTQDMATELANETDITLVCGRYEGIDARLGDFLPLEETSVCQCVLNGGETGALAIIEAVSRLIPGFMGCQESAAEESFADNLLEYPQYTRPYDFRGRQVPHILASGNHGLIAQWRREQALLKTLGTRPDLLEDAPLSARDASYLADVPRFRAGRNISFCLMHHPVYLDHRRVGTSSLTNLDVHDIARISSSYGMGRFFILTPLVDQLALLKNILRHWTIGPAARTNTDRRDALDIVRPVASIAELDELAADYYGTAPTYVVASARWPGKIKTVTCRQLRHICQSTPVVICLGTAQGLDLKSLPFSFLHLRPLRYLNANHLSVRAAAAIMADRIMGDFY